MCSDYALSSIVTVTYPGDVHSLKHLHPRTKYIQLQESYAGIVSNVCVWGNGNTMSGIIRRCYLANCALTNAVLIHTRMQGCTITGGALAHNVETNGTCSMKDVHIYDNVKGFVNMGHINMQNCNVDNNITGIESRGILEMRECRIENNSVGVHTCGELVRETVEMRNNTINLLRTQPARPAPRCWMQ